MKIVNDFDFEPPFANPEPEREEVSDTYIPCTVYLSAENVEFLTDVMLGYISDNAEVLDNSEWCKVQEILDILKIGTIPGRAA